MGTSFLVDLLRSSPPQVDELEDRLSSFERG